jgi:hypothetical protein
MRDLELVIPPLAVQEEISSSAISVYQCIDAKKRHKKKLEGIKSAISADLLSGRKRVSI